MFSSQPNVAASEFPVGKTPCSTPDGDPVILMCPPAFFTVSYAINPWMEEAPPCDTALAKQQWDTLYDTVLNTAGAHVELLEPVAELPDLVFTANAAFVYEDTAVIARYKHPERQPEEEVCADWFAHQGFQVFRMPNELPFEGAGDALIWNNRILAGYGTRTALESHALLSQAIGLPVVSLELTNPCFYHIDVCLCPLADGSLIYAPSTFTVEGLARLEAEVPPDKRILVSAAEAARFACNAVNINDKIILNQGSPDLVAALKSRGFQVIPVNLSEFLKAGGSAKCLSLRVG
jgi:N-dimethylarginine dimethylaminohydrolase